MQNEVNRHLDYHPLVAPLCYGNGGFEDLRKATMEANTKYYSVYFFSFCFVCFIFETT